MRPTPAAWMVACGTNHGRGEVAGATYAALEHSNLVIISAGGRR